MIDFVFPPTPTTPTWEEPTDTDLTQIALCCYKFNILFDTYHAQGLRIRQVEQADGEALVSDANVAIAAILDDMSSVYGS